MPTKTMLEAQATETLHMNIEWMNADDSLNKVFHFRIFVTWVQRKH
jgi:hypothetical protein